jgi:hypothetical protein
VSFPSQSASCVFSPSVSACNPCDSESSRQAAARAQRSNDDRTVTRYCGPLTLSNMYYLSYTL